jgi:hypothetical protein
MVTNLILVCMMCGCNMYVIPRSVSRKDLGYKSHLDSFMDADANLCPYCSPQGRECRLVVPARVEGGVSCPGGSNLNDPMAEGSRVLPLLPSPSSGVLRGSPWSLPQRARPGSCLEGLVHCLKRVVLGQGSPVLPIALWQRSPAGTITIGIGLGALAGWA